MRYTPDNPHNFCRRCELDFTSLRAFDAHFAGDPAFNWSPDREDGFRCRDEDELLAAGLEPDGAGRWRIAVSDAGRERLSALPGSASDATGAPRRPRTRAKS